MYRPARQRCRSTAKEKNGHHRSIGIDIWNHTWLVLNRSSRHVRHVRHARHERSVPSSSPCTNVPRCTIGDDDADVLQRGSRCSCVYKGWLIDMISPLTISTRLAVVHQIPLTEQQPTPGLANICLQNNASMYDAYHIDVIDKRCTSA